MNSIVNHKQIASQCFNQVWDLLDLLVRTHEQEEEMIHLAHTSFWHWTQVEGHTPLNLSIGYWQLSRVYSVVGNGERALYYGTRCVEVSLGTSVPPFYLGYAYEAIARAYMVLGQKEEVNENYQKAIGLLEQVEDNDSRIMLENDLKAIIL